MDQQTYMMNTLTETQRRCQAENIGISRRMITTLAKSGQIPSVKTGNKILVNWDGLMRYLETNTLEPPDEPESENGIRRISE